MTPKVSIVIRCKNEARDIGSVLRAIASQKTDIAYEVIAVDSGSTDGTLDVIREFPVRLIEIPPESFTFGYALNVGFEAAKGAFALSLSAHVYPQSVGWLAAHVRHFDNPKVAATCTARDQLVLQDLSAFLRHPHAGCDNANGAYRISLWRQYPFNESLTGTEDKEWGYHFQKQGYLIAMDPDVYALHEHPTDTPMDLIHDRYIRSFREHEAYTRFLSRWVLFKSLGYRLMDRGMPKNRESLAWYAGACMGIVKPG